MDTPAETPARNLRTLLNDTLIGLRSGEVKPDIADSIARNANAQTRIAVAEVLSCRQKHHCDFFMEIPKTDNG